MKNFLFVLASMLAFSSGAQTITIEKTNYPYYDIFEWKGMGGILMSKDPGGNNKQINLTLVGNAPKSIWDQRFMPKNDDFYFISSENARYVYFLHNLDPENGKIYFDQLNSAGNVKATSASLTSAIKKLGDYDLSNLELRNVVVTDKALVHQFRYHDKKGKSYTEIATFMTHHNMLVYAAVLGSTTEESLKNKTANHWRYIGFTEDRICFAERGKSAKSNGWQVKTFSSKGELVESTFLKAGEQTFKAVGNIGFGTTGSYYLKSEEDVQEALLSFHANRFYLSGVVADGGKSTLQLFEHSEGTWKKRNEHIIEPTSSNKGVSLGVYPLNEGIGYHVQTAADDLTMVLKYDQSAAIVHPFTTKTVFNPSRVLIAEKNELFAVTLPEGILFFNLDQLKKDSDVQFEFQAK